MRIRPLLASAILICAPVGVRAQNMFEAHDHTVSCADIPKLDAALANDDQHYFSGWSDGDYDSAATVVKSCLKPRRPLDLHISPIPPIPMGDPNAHAREDLIARLAAHRDEQVKREQAAALQAAQRAAEQAGREQAAAIEAAQRAAQRAAVHDACVQSVNYQRYEVQERMIEVQERIIKDVGMIDRAKSGLAKEQKIGEISGAVNPSRLHAFGQEIVSYGDDLDNAWRDYKALGGRADNFKSVRQELSNPCLESSTEAPAAPANWKSLLVAKITRAWLRPPSAVRGLECVVQVTQVPGGAVTDVRIGTCNGDQAVRESIQAAVYRASPLPQPPDPKQFDPTIEIRFKPDID